MVAVSPAGHDQLMAPAVVLAPAQGLVVPGRGGGPTRVRHAEPGHRRWRLSGSYLECWRRAAISSSLLIAERPSSPAGPGWSPPLSATIVPWWSSSTSQPPDSRPTTRSVAWCSASIWSAPDGSALLRLGASSIQTDQEWSCRIVWMINGMIKPRG
jgi:hypothetical protein